MDMNPSFAMTSGNCIGHKHVNGNSGISAPFASTRGAKLALIMSHPNLQGEDSLIAIFKKDGIVGHDGRAVEMPDNAFEWEKLLLLSWRRIKTDGLKREDDAALFDHLQSSECCCVRLNDGKFFLRKD